MKTILVDARDSAAQVAELADLRFGSLAEAVNAILAARGAGS
jgi:hypothetical protein